MKKLLIANRGEIACRVARTARKMAIETVGVHSEADAQSKHVSVCDSSVLIGPSDARQSYLDIGKILQAARDSGADALHPGYGFLSENPALAQACHDAGILFVGPDPHAITAMADKARAKVYAQRAGMPLIPGYYGESQDDQLLRAEADLIGYPVIIKARKGGGGRGMRIVRKAEDFESALASCRREALAGFGDDTVMVERYIESPRHIEVQVFGDRHGNVLHLFERDCSVQRRHQKVIEESPAFGISQTQRHAMGEAAAALARSVGYVGAGTVECIVDPEGNFYFLEMNTRLQVEHGVTEQVLGLDLVEWQLRVARGEPLPVTQSELRLDGHCFEVRVCAERPAKNFLPSVGKIEAFSLPDHIEFGPGPVRVDSGVRAQDSVSPYYDSMIAKVLVRAADREHARLAMLQALDQIEINGVQTNLEFLKAIFAHSEFETGGVHTGFIDTHLKSLLNTSLVPSPT